MAKCSTNSGQPPECPSCGAQHRCDRARCDKPADTALAGFIFNLSGGRLFPLKFEAAVCVCDAHADGADIEHLAYWVLAEHAMGRLVRLGERESPCGWRAIYNDGSFGRWRGLAISTRGAAA